MDFVVFLATKLLEDPRIFEQHKAFIEAQYRGSRSFFQKWFSGKDFKQCARDYLRKVCLIG